MINGCTLRGTAIQDGTFCSSSLDNRSFAFRYLAPLIEGDVKTFFSFSGHVICKLDECLLCHCLPICDLSSLWSRETLL